MRWNYRWLRHPRTTQEKRRNSQPDEKQYVRGKRACFNLPDAYDDFWLPHKRNESWKRLRKTQYHLKDCP